MLEMREEARLAQGRGEGMTDKTGGPAFPVPAVTPTDMRGATLRDYFAGESLKGYRSGDQMAPANVVAHDSYADADAMLKERDK